MADKDKEIVTHLGKFHNLDGTVEPCRLYHTEDQCPGAGFKVDDSYVRWHDSDGVMCIQQGTDVSGSASVGASKTYSSKYDEIDWGN